MLMRYQWIRTEKQRYYTVQVGQDLLGEWVVAQYWGNLWSRRGGHQQTLCASQAAAEAKVVQIARRRQYRRYQPVAQSLSGEAAEPIF